MAKGWKCARCSTANPEGAITCSNCGLIHGGVVPTGAYTRLPDPLPNTLAMPVPEPPTGDDPAAIDPETAPAAAGVGPEAWSTGIAPVDLGGTPSTVRPIWRRIPVGWIVVLVLLVGGGIGGALFNASRSSSGEITNDGNLSANELRVGDCFDLKDPGSEKIGDVTARPCSDEHEYEVFYIGSLPDGEYPTEAAFQTFVDDKCGPAFGAYIGKAYEDSELDFLWLFPESDGWKAGDRSVQCTAYHPRIHRLTGSLKGSNR